MFGSIILVLFLPLLFLDGALLDSFDSRQPQPGQPWVSLTFIKDSDEDKDVAAYFDTDASRGPQPGKPWVALPYMTNSTENKHGAYLDSDTSHRPQPGKPWVAQTYMTNPKKEQSQPGKPWTPQKLMTNPTEERSQTGKPWVAPIYMTNPTEQRLENNLPRYISQAYQSPASAPATMYIETSVTRRFGNSVRGYKCPQPHGYFKYTPQCAEYVKCKNYIPMTYTCPDGLHFNPSMQWSELPCDHPSRVQCNGESVESYLRFPPLVTPTPPPRVPAPEVIVPPLLDNQLLGFKCSQPYGYFKITGQCDKYVECKNYVPLQSTCPAGHHFNPRVQWPEYPCGYPSEVQCSEESPSTTSTTTTTTTTTPAPTTTTTYRPKYVTTPRPIQRPSGFMCPQPHGYYKHNDQCSEYVECKNHVPLSFTCPVGLHFNPIVPWTEYPCDHPSRVECNRELVNPEDRFIPPSSSSTTSTTSTTTTTTTTTTPPPIIEEPVYDEPEIADPEIEPRYEIQQPNDLCPQPYGYFKHTNHCGQYVECKNYVPLRFKCPSGLHFNPRVKWTDYPCEHPLKVQCY